MNFSSSFQMIPHSRTITGHVLCEPVSLRAIASASLSCVQGDIAAWFAKLLKPPSVQADWALQPDALLLHPIHLPSELLISVVEPLQHSKRDLSALMFCCRQLYWIARPFFYRTLYTPRRYALSGLTRLTAWLTYQPDLLAALQHLDFDWEQPDSMVWMLVQNAVALKRLREDVLPNTHHLRTLVIPESMLHTRTIWLLEGLPRSVDRLALTRPGGTDDSLWFADAVLRAFKLLDSAVEENPEYELSGRTHLFMNTHSLLCFPQALRILRRSTNVTRVAFGCAEFGACAKHLHRLVECGLAFESLTVNCLSLWLLSTSSLPLAFENLHTLHVVPKSPPSSPDDFHVALSALSVMDKFTELFPRLRTILFHDIPGGSFQTEPSNDTYAPPIFRVLPVLETLIIEPWSVTWRRDETLQDPLCTRGEQLPVPRAWYEQQE